MSSQYMDEKHPDVVYEVIPVIEEVTIERKKRPLWRRVVRLLLAITVASMIWSTVAPVMHHKCGKMMRHKHHLESHHKHRPNHDAWLEEDSHDVAGPLRHYTFPADLDHFWLVQESFGGISRVEVNGRVIVKSCEKAENITANFKLDSTDDGILDKVEIEPRKSGIKFRLDPFSLVKQTVNATVFLTIPKSEEYKLKRFHIGTIGMNVWLTKSFNTPINATYISTVSGHVGSHGHGADLLDIAHLKIKTVSGNIFGAFPIEHALALETTSGNIHAHLAAEDIPEKEALFKTETVSGETHCHFHGALTPRPLYSKHTSVNGDIKVNYPVDWQGGMKIETTSGHIGVVGEGTKIVKKEKNLTKKLWEVIKGDGESKAYFGSVSGDIDILVGDKEKDD